MARPDEGGSAGDCVEAALAGTETVIWAVDLDTATPTMGHGPVEAVFRLEPSVIESVSTFFERGVHPDDAPDLEDAYRAILDGETEQFQVIFRTHPDNGVVNWLEVVGNVDSDGEDWILGGIATNVTEWHGRLRRLDRHNDRLKQFAGVVAHDLRNPLNVAGGQVELARERCDSDHLVTAAESLEEMQSLIEDLLEAVDSGAPIIRGSAMNGAEETVALPSLAETCWENVEAQGATLRVATDETVRTNRTRLKQLLENLLRNAVDHGGTDVTVTVGDTGQQNGLYVADDGPGIPESKRDRIFESGYSTSEDGFGLGLHIVDEIVESQGWDISVTDSDHGGARFEVTGL